MGQLRIVAGKWRGRKINFNEQGSARPTLDRVRETLFNWLNLYIHEHTTCLDLFAGSGILGIEALSHGAREAIFIDNQAPSLDVIQSNLDKLEATLSRCYAGQLPRCLEKFSEKQFDIIFLDPPFRTTLLQQTLDKVHQLNLLSHQGVIYFEAEKEAEITMENWQILKHKFTKTLQYGLLKNDP